jgi:aspartate/methionine/tyrosine aminotransferase
VLLVSDNPYSEIAFDGVVPPSILEIEGAKDVAIEFNSLSKTYNMAGLRIGMGVGNAEVVAAMAAVKEPRSTSGPSPGWDVERGVRPIPARPYGRGGDPRVGVRGGGEGHVRISLAVADERLREAMGRLVAVSDRLRAVPSAD